MKFLVVSCSLSPGSRSRLLAQFAAGRLRELGAEVEFLDLSELRLPMCDGGACYGLPEVQALAAHVAAAQGILVAAPVYNYDVNAAAKNLVELTGRAWTGKVVGFICAAGGTSSYMSVMGLANSLMLDFRCHIVPRFVYAPDVEVADAEYGEQPIAARVEGLVREIVRITAALGESAAG